ncbi:methyltransferase domain-containing protein [Arcanobacterium ihumii]|uniref:methyltransferase domain-containing protein n=1 Tax=Arcanobacterium ihumii TaxID=2138162 RepID=UPI001F37500A|nr:methyltransferase domain-containing protein [Arcanobacterium ihumii]
MPEQLQVKEQVAYDLIDASEWLSTARSRTESFRNKVKLVVTGSVSKPQLGIAAPMVREQFSPVYNDGRSAREFGGNGVPGVDLRDCPLPTTGIRAATPALTQFIKECELQPYNPVTDQGVLKYVIVVESPSGDLMLRFVVRRRGAQGIFFKKYDRLRELVPMLSVCSVNVQPEHKAVIEGNEEILISDRVSMPMPVVISDPATEIDDGVASLELELRPQSFFQTNTEMAEELYRRAAQWAAGAENAWDLYCGIGGFAFALAHAGVTRVTGVETSEDAVAAGNKHAQSMKGVEISFVAADATQWVKKQSEIPDLVVVNPPRRGIGDELARWLNDSGVERIIYSSCNAQSLSVDLVHMQDFRVRYAQVVDMFPHTNHFETIVLLERVYSIH